MMSLNPGNEGDDEIDEAAAEESRRRARMARAVAGAAAAKGMSASDSLRVNLDPSRLWDRVVLSKYYIFNAYPHPSPERTRFCWCLECGPE